MRDGNWFRQGRGRSKGGKSRSKVKRGRTSLAARDHGRLSFEALEDRRMLATYLVNVGTDIVDGAVSFGSLRWAVNASNATPDDNDYIVFADNVSSVALNGGQLTLTDEVRILGPGPRKLTITQTRANARIFETNIGAGDEAFPVEISGVTLSGGNIIGDGDERRGGAVFNRESLRMTEVIVQGNSASRGGGGIYSAFGSLTLDRSLIINNFSNVGGGIMNGADGEDARPTTNITNSTITGNSASGGGGDQYPVGYGGGVFNRNGRLTITNSTITLNNSTLGSGVGSWGNPLPDEPGGPIPAPTVFTTISHSIIVGNNASDVDRVGKSDDDPPLDLRPSINLDPNDPTMGFVSPGFNIVGTGNATAVGPDQAFQDVALGGEDYLGLLVEDVLQVDFDPLLGYGDLEDYGGSTDVFLLAPGSVAIDGGDPNRGREFEQRGRHFVGVYDYLQLGLDPIVDIGAVEMQSGEFFVDTLIDEDDDIFSFINRTVIEFGTPFVEIGYYDQLGDFSLREALNFARKNPGIDTIRFSDTLLSEEVLDREDQTASLAPTILLDEGYLLIDDEVIIEGPSSFVLEIDASGNDFTKDVNEGNGTRVFVVDDFDSTNFLNVFISNLTVMGADFNGEGGGIFTRENLTLSHMTFKDNSVTNDGGAIFVKAGQLEVKESTFKENRASDDGGAVFIDSGASGPQSGAAFENSTFSANVAGDKGAGIYNNNSHLLVAFSTITLNDAGSTRGHGIANAGANALTTLWASIVAGNSPDELGNGSNDVEYVTVPPGATINGFNSLGHNLIGTGNAKNAFNQTGDVRDALNPRLAPLTNTGGLIETHRPVYDANPALRSQAIDMGPDLLGGAPPLIPPDFDQRGEGFARQAGLRADAGAYEVQRMVLFVSSLSDENDGDTSFGNFSLREAIELANKNPTLPNQLADEIQFDPLLVAALPFFQDNAINLGVSGLQPFTAPDIRITDSLSIVGPGSDLLAVDGSGLASFFIPQTAFFSKGSRMFTVDDGIGSNFIDVQISGLTFRNALAPQAGGAFWSTENLSFDQVAFLNNHTVDPDEAGFGQPVIDLQGLHGGALFQQQGTLSIANSLISGNTTTDATAHGGAIYVGNGNLDVRYSTVAGNSVEHSGNGGAIHVKNSNFTSVGNTISGNATLGGVGDGGGFFSDGSTVELRDTVVSTNTTHGANSEGGGFAAISSSVTLLDSVVSLNTTSGSQSHGGGFFARGGDVTLTRSIVSQNTASGQNALGGGIALTLGTVTLEATTVDRNRVTNLGTHGGGIANLGGMLSIRNSTVNANQALHSQALGGGVFSDDILANGLPVAHTTLIENSTVSGNSAGFRGGGVFNVDGVTDIRHSTITNNSTPFMNAGNGVASHGSSTTLTRFYSSIVAGNVGAAAGTGSDVDTVIGMTFNSIQSLGFNLIGTGNSLVQFTPGLGDQEGVTNPGLAALTNNGGVTRSHALLAGSLAIDKGSATAAAGIGGVPAHDQRGLGFTRVFNGDGVGPARIDVGAFELQSPGYAADFSGDDVVDGTDFLSWQRNVATPNPTKATGDGNGDNTVNSGDLAVWQQNFGAGSADVAAVAAATAASSSSSQAAIEVSLVASASASTPTESAPLSLANSAPVVVSAAAPAARAEHVAASFIGLGRPGVLAADGAFARFGKQADRHSAATIAVPSHKLPTWLASDKADDADLSLLDDALAGEDGEHAEDAVFADWDASFSA
jgi:predicted outer membrane repeat protein